jgi:hypothetical protein
MRECPKCNYRDPPYWRPAKMNNPSGDIDIARIDDLLLFETEIGRQLTLKRGIEAVTDGHFAYYIGKRGVWVRRVSLRIFKDCGIAAFKPPCETSGHNKLAIQIPKTRLLDVSKEQTK